MPTYEFRCPNNHLFERVLPTSSKTRRLKCPTCGKMAERIISGGAGLVFKGSGFYITDYKRAGETADGTPKSATSEKPEKAEKADKPAKAETPAESKPKPKK